MEMDWEFLANGIQQIGSMVAGTIVEQYRQKEAEKRFLGRYREMMEIQEPYKTAQSQRNIAEALKMAQNAMGVNKEYTQWKTKYTNDMTANLNSEVLVKKREQIMKKRDPEGLLWLSSLDKVAGKAQRYEEFDDADEAFKESLDVVSRVSLNNLQLQKKQYDDNFSLQMENFKNQTARLMTYIGRGEETEQQRFWTRAEDIENKKVKLAGMLKDLVGSLFTEGDLIVDKGIGFLKKGDQNIPLLTDEGLFSEEAKKKLIELKPMWGSKFAEVDVLKEAIKRLEELQKQSKQQLEKERGTAGGLSDTEQSILDITK